MSLPQVGWASLTYAGVLFGAAASENAIVVGAILGALVAVSTLMIRIIRVIDNRIDVGLTKRQASGDLPTPEQWRDMRETLHAIADHLIDE